MMVYVLTSDRYIHCLRPFAYLFNKFWDKDQPVMVVGYEQAPADLPTNFSFLSLGNQKDFTWSSGAIRFLELIPDNRFILLLEDYFIAEPVKVSAIKTLFNYYHKTVKIDLTDDRAKVAHRFFGDVGGHPMIQSDDNSLFQTSLQAAIWDKHFMRRYLNPAENAWEFEKRGTQRLMADRREGRFYGHILGFMRPPLTYINAIGGMGNKPDQFDFKKFPQWMIKELKEKGLL